MKAAIVGVTGYTGQLLLRLLANHPEVDQVIPVSSSKSGQTLQSADRGLGYYPKADITGGMLVSVDEAAALKPDVVFAALPHLKSAEICAPFFANSVVIDLSADFRIEDPAMFFTAYGQQPPRPDLLNKAVYGLVEVYEERIKKADLIANPGCYPTATMLPLIPLLSKFNIKGKIIVNALSGVSGAGKKAEERYSFCECTESTAPYAPGKAHRHTIEIQKELSKFNLKSDVFFTPHLIPVRRGMEVTTFVELEDEVSTADVIKLWTKAYSGRPFVKILGDKDLPNSKDVCGSNRCDMACKVIDGKNLMLFSVIDNLVKGASGQAVQNMNIRFGFNETAGLEVNGLV